MPVPATSPPAWHILIEDFGDQASSAVSGLALRSNVRPLHGRGERAYLREMQWPEGGVMMALALVACGPDELGPAILGEVCGADGPFQLVAFDSDQQLRGEPLAFEDRFYYIVLRTRTSGGETRALESTLWSIGACGESP